MPHVMYEAREGEFHYTIESRMGGDGRRTWLWRVNHRFRLIATGESGRSHVHAETQALAAIFAAESDGRSLVAASLCTASSRILQFPPDPEEAGQGAPG